MKLDSRIIIPHTEILTCFDTDSENARKTVGKKGYFSFRLGSFYDLSTCDYGTLDLIDTANRDDDHGSDDVFHRKENDCYYSYFISEEFIALKEKKYRPYTIEEFCDMGFEFVVFRDKNDPPLEYHVRYNGYRKCGNFYKVILGNISYSFSDLFENFEYFYNGRWKPFGVKE